MSIVLKYLNDIYAQVKQLDATVRRSLWIIVVMLFLLLGSYPFIRIASEAYFNLAYGSEDLPKVWIGAVGVLSLSMLIYNFCQNRFTAQKLYFLTMAVTVLFFSSCIWGISNPLVQGLGRQAFIYHFYMWKEVYIILLLHMAFCYFNTLFTLPVAKLLYGPLGAVMGIAGWLGSLIAKLDLTNGVILPTIVGMVMIILSGLLFLFLPPRPLRSSGTLSPAAVSGAASVSSSSSSSSSWANLMANWKTSLPKSGHWVAKLPSPLKTVRQVWPYVTGLVLLMMLSQFVINLANYAFNSSLDGLGDLISRKQYLSTCYVWINGLSVVVQLFVVAPLFQLVSQKVIHFIIPFIYLFAAGWGIGPAASALSLGAAYVVIKGVDYSLFSTAKEIFYFHLNAAQKYGAKYLVDMVSYRLGKALISLVLLNEVLNQIKNVKILLFVCLALWPMLLGWIFCEQQRMMQKNQQRENLLPHKQ